MDPTSSASIIKVEGVEIRRIDDVLIREQEVVVRVEGRDILRTVCSPGGGRELAYGHLASEGWIGSPNDVDEVLLDPGSANISVRLRERCVMPRCEPAPVESDYTVRTADVLSAARSAEAEAKLFRATGGTHVAVVLSADGRRAAAEDISRTCALEKALGAALLAGADLRSSILFLTSRIPRSFVRKAARVGIPIVAAVSAPTFEAVEEAERLGICLCGFVRGDRFNAYSRPSRVGLR
jgi:FdhD protein